jgi:predicted dehydrogenase
MAPGLLAQTVCTLTDSSGSQSDGHTDSHSNGSSTVFSNGVSAAPTTNGRLRVGLLGIGEIAQCVHLPTLAMLSHLFVVTAICDISQEALALCATKFHIKKTYTRAEDLCADPNVDVVFILTSDEFHASQTITALEHNKHVLVEKPVSISLASAQRMLEAEGKSEGRVFVAYMRRYATAMQTFLKEMPAKEDIKFVRVRDIIGPNPHFVNQSGTFPQRFTDYPPEAMEERSQAAEKLLREVYPNHAKITPLMTRFCRFLGGLGSHDLSVMREALGMPKSCTGVSMHPPFFTATFEYENFAVAYESGIDAVPRFDSHLQVYGQDKTIQLRYDTPYVKGLPVMVQIDEKTQDGAFQSREIRPTYEDPYTQELRELHECLTDGKAIKTTITDAMEDLQIFQMILNCAFPTISVQHSEGKDSFEVVAS